MAHSCPRRSKMPTECARAHARPWGTQGTLILTSCSQVPSPLHCWVKETGKWDAIVKIQRSQMVCFSPIFVMTAVMMPCGPTVWSCSSLSITRISCVPFWGLSLPFYEQTQEDFTLNRSLASNCFCITQKCVVFQLQALWDGNTAAHSPCVLQITWWRRA